MARVASIVVIISILFSGYIPTANAFSFLTFEARSAAMGGVGVATDPRNGVYYNPALLATDYEDYNWFAFVPAVGLSISDPDDLESGLENFQSAANQLKNAPSQENADTAADALANLEDQVYRERQAISIALGVPNSTIAATTYVNRYEIHTAKTEVGSPSIDPNNPSYESSLEHRGIKVLELGVAGASLFGTYKLGAGIKLMLIDGIGYSEPIEDASLELKDKGEISQSSTFNVDLGLSKEWGVWKFGLSAKNLVPLTIDLGDTGETVSLDPVVRTGLAYRSRRTYLEFDIDLLKVEHVGYEEKALFAGLGWEYQVLSWFYLRLGYQQDVVGEQLPTGTYGLGLNISGFQFDFGGMSNQDGNSVYANLLLRMD